jgi:hypothetical protein
MRLGTLNLHNIYGIGVPVGDLTFILRVFIGFFRESV